jgi:type II secretion system protein J
VVFIKSRACAKGALISRRRSLPAAARHLPAFTLIEVLVAVLITAGIAGASAVAVSRALKSQEVARARQESFARAALAVDAVAADVQNLVRSGDLYDARVLIVDSSLSTGSARDEMLLFSRNSRPVRPSGEQNEADAYEVQYRLEAPPDIAATGYVLWRRADPVPDEVPDGGGIAAPLASGITALSIQAFDGASWLDSWDSDRDGYPHAIRITAGASDGRGQRESVARRTIAVDRTPIPYATVSTESQSSGGGGE